MQKMFLCENGMLFPIDDVYSVFETRDYQTTKGKGFTPDKIFTVEAELVSAMNEDADRKMKVEKNFFDVVAEFIEILSDLGGLLFVVIIQLIWWPVAKLMGRDWSLLWRELSADEVLQARKEAEEQVRSDSKRRRDNYYENGFYLSSDRTVWCMKQWEVKLKGQGKSIRISNTDHEKLCVEMGCSLDKSGAEGRGQTLL